MNDRTRPPFFWLTVLACVIYLSLFVFSVVPVVRHYGQRRYVGWSTVQVGQGWIVATVSPDGPASGRIEPGDRLLAINGDERSAVLGGFPVGNVQPGETYRVDLERRGGRVHVELPLAIARGHPFQPIFLLYSLTFFACGAGLSLLRPGDAQVRLIGLTLMSVGASLLIDSLGEAGGFLTGGARTTLFFITCLAGWTFPMTYHFFSRFPAWRSPGPLWRGVQWLLYGLFVLVFWPAWISFFLVTFAMSERALDFFYAHPSVYLTASSIVQRWSFIYILLCLTLALVVAGRNYQHLRDAGSRRRIRWVLAGLMAACIPYLVLMFSYWIAGWISLDTYGLAYPVVSFALLCIPASIVAAVWKEQLFDIRVLVRRGLQYLLARTALRILLVLPFAVLALSILGNPNRTIAQILTEGRGWLNFVWMGAVAAALRFRPTLQTSLDRRFFREAYEQEQVLLQLIDEVRQCDSIAAIAGLVSTRIDSVLHPTTLHVFYREQERGEMIAGHSSSGSLIGRGGLSDQQALLRMMDGAERALDFPSDFGTLPDAECQWLESLGVALVVPITGTQNRLIGLLLLGERRSDEPYSATDRHLLQAIAAQIGLVYENQHLQNKVRSDADVRREVLARLGERSVNLLKECPVCGLCYDGSAAACESDAAELVLTLPVERTLDGKYRLERALGRGGMGAVYAATDLRLQRRVAAKVMIGSHFGDQVALRRFEREARAAARLDHRNITMVYDYGAVGSGGAYLIMELVAGRTWRSELQRSGVIDPVRATEWFRQLLEGLHLAHRAGVVHRDLKPENVMIVPTPDGHDQVKIMDFGLAQVYGAGTGMTETLTAAGVAMGTFGYMAPEALVAGPVDARADLFAIGVMVVETLLGERPFRGHNPQEIIAALLQSSYHFAGDSTEILALDGVVQRCLAKDPFDRYASARALADDLLPALSGCRTSSFVRSPP